MTKMIRIIYILFLTFLAFEIEGQNIKGFIYSSDNLPLQGAAIRLKEIPKITYSSEKGYFELKDIPDGKYTLEITFVGFKKQTISVESPFRQNLINIVLADEALTLDQIIVTATKHEENIENLPVSAEVIPLRAIESRNRTTLDEALRYIPGVTMSLDQISIRGSSGYSKGAGTRVLTAIDGIPIYTGDTGEIIWEMLPVSNIERVEIVKGPASSLYGSTAIGGVINIITKSIYEKPITQFSSYAGFYSNPYYSQWKWSDKIRSFYGVGINHSNTIGNVGYSLTLKKSGNDGYRENDFSKRNIGYTKINLQIDSINHLSLFVNYLNMERGNFLYWKDGANGLIPKDEDNGKIVKSDRWFGSLIYKHIFSTNFSAELKSSFYYSYFKGIGVEITASKSNLVRNEILTYWSPSHLLAFTTGSEFSYSTISSNIFNSKIFKTFSFFTQAEFKGITDLIATLGLRYDSIKLDSLAGTDAITTKIGFNYKIRDNLILRSSFGTGFRAPTPAEVFTSIGVGSIPIKENPGLTFEESISFDAGLLYKLLPNISFDFSLFYNGYNNFIEPVLLRTGYIQFINLPKAKTVGFELQTDSRFFNDLVKANFGYTYLWSKDIENDTPMKYRPLNSVNFSLDITLYPFEFGLDFRFMSKAERIDEDLVRPPLSLVPDGDKRVDVYVTDISTGYNFSIGLVPVKLIFFCKNLFNYNYVEFIGNIAPIRNYSVSLNMFF